jgi:hypothetical protein
LDSAKRYLQNLGALPSAEILHIWGDGFHISLNFINSLEDLENKNQIQGNLSGNLESLVGKFLLISSGQIIAPKSQQIGNVLLWKMVNRVKLGT